MGRFDSLGLNLKNPVIVASGPLTAKLRHLQEAEENGAGAVSLKLTFVNVPFEGLMRAYSVPNSVMMTPIERRLDIKEGTKLARQARKNTSLVLFANMGASGDNLDDWKRLADEFQNAGVHALELNFCCPNLETAYKKGQKREKAGIMIAQAPEQCYRITKTLRGISSVPIVCKFVLNMADIYKTAYACRDGGADGIHIAGLPVSGLPPVDFDANNRPKFDLMEGVSYGSTNGSICKYSTFMSVSQLAMNIGLPVIASGGFDDWRDCVSAVMWGADSVSICSAIMWRGFEMIKQINEDVEEFMRNNNYEKFSDFKGIALKHIVPPNKLKLKKGSSKIDSKLCIGCGRCLKPGHCDAIVMKNKKAKTIPRDCIGCGVCVTLCPVGAIRMVPAR